MEWCVSQNPELVDLARYLNHAPMAASGSAGEPFHAREDPGAEFPRLRLATHSGGRNSREEGGLLLSTHPGQSDEISGGSMGSTDAIADEDPELMALTRDLDRYLARRREGEGA